MQASIKDLKNNLSAYLKKVQNGEELIITSHNHTIAKIIPLNDNLMKNSIDQTIFLKEIQQLHHKLRKIKLKTSMRDTVLQKRESERN